MIVCRPQKYKTFAKQHDFMHRKNAMQVVLCFFLLLKTMDYFAKSGTLLTFFIEK